MADSPAYFQMTDTDGDDEFVIKIIDPEKIEHARRILDGSEKSRVHVQGTVVKEPAVYNPTWNFHIAPETIDFFEYAIEVCDASIVFVHENLDDVGGSTLPNCHWCPWSSRLVKEVTRAKSEDK